MTDDTDIARLQAHMDTVQRDILEIKGQLASQGGDLRRIAAWVEREEGAKKALEKAAESQTSRAELSWTKVMALAAAIGTVGGVVVSAVPYLIRAHAP
jgi:fructose/tagatose bisphosphate aldolase